ncbi:MAG TPA: EAL domain-containing protein [Thermoanaerobaculia bacterium]|nr:EAL domain-containing protein [Thermoanaerobaculia bacterium]
MANSQLDYQSFFERNLAGVYRCDLTGRIVDCNEALAATLGYSSKQELIADGRIDYCNSSDRETILAALGDLHSLSNLEVCLKKKDDSLVWVFQNITLVPEQSGQLPLIEGVLLEITEQRLATERMQHQVYHDALTGLPNQTLFKDRLTVALARSRREGAEPVGVMFLDMDNFTLINRTFGQGIGDRLLKGVADRLAESFGHDETLSRHGSDEFTLLFPAGGGAESAAMLAQQVLDTVSQPILLDGNEMYVNTSIGIALYPEDGTDADTLMKSADVAMYRAKDKGKNTYQLYTPAMNARAFERLALITSLRRAIDKNEFLLHFQPEVNVQTGRISCIEALLRWNHPELGLVEPAHFIAAAEDASLLAPIGDWVLREACKQARLWQRAGLPATRVSVNLSTSQLYEQTLASKIEAILHDTGLEADNLQLEINESSMQDLPRSIMAMRALKDVGVTLALDNFGSGRSSLSDLKVMPLDSVKIDRSFIQGITRRSDDAAIVSAIIALARGLNLRVVAEGVETLDQLSFLRDRRCADMQGFFFGKPHSAATVTDMLRMQDH